MKVYPANSSDSKIRKTSFKSHPEYKKLAKFYDIKASSYFRRGRSYGPPSDDFSDVICCLKDIFFRKTPGMVKMLIAGIGDSQEPFSLLAVIKKMLQNNRLKDNLDLTIVDMQSKPRKKRLFYQSFLDCAGKPRYMSEVFIKDNGEKYGFENWKHYRVNDEILEFLRNTYNNPEKSYWNTRIQDIIKTMPDETFDVVSINNTLGYIDNAKVIKETANHVMRTIKKDRIFITDPDPCFDYVSKDKASEIFTGIFKKG